MTMSTAEAKRLAQLPEHRPTYNAVCKAIESLGTLTPMQEAQAEGVKMLALKIDQLYSVKTGTVLMGYSKAIKDLSALLNALAAPTAAASADLFRSILSDEDVA